MQEKERRATKRVKKTLYVQGHTINTDSTWFSATLQDISERGMSIVARREFAKGEELEIKVRTFLRATPILVLGKVVNCEARGEGAAHWVVHISITEINEEDETIFKDSIKIFLEMKQVVKKKEPD